MVAILTTAGVVCWIAAIVGGGLKAFQIEVPALNSLPRQFLLGFVGALLLGGAWYYNSPSGGKEAPPQPAPQRPFVAEPQIPGPSPGEATNGSPTADEQDIQRKSVEAFFKQSKAERDACLHAGAATGQGSFGCPPAQFYMNVCTMKHDATVCDEVFPKYFGQ